MQEVINEARNKADVCCRMLTYASCMQEVINVARNKAETFLNHYNHNRRSSCFKSSMGRRQSSFGSEALQVCSRMLTYAGIC